MADSDRNVSLKIVHQLDRALWRSVYRHPGSSIFHTPEMFEVFSRVSGYTPQLWAAIDGEENLLALFLPLQITLFDGLLRRLTTRAVAYGSVLYDPSLAGQVALKRLLDAYNERVKRQLLFTELRNVSDMGAVQSVLSSCGFAYAEHLNYLIDLDRSPEAIMQGFGSRTRKQIRRALRQHQVVIETLTSRDQLGGWYEVMQQTYRRNQVPLADRSLFESAFDVLYPKDMILFSAARVGDVYAAVSVELLYKDVIYGWYGGTDRVYGNLYPNELLTWHILEWGAQNGFRVYDFGGAGKPEEEYGVRNFKAKFGGDLVGFGRNTCVHSPLLLKLSTLGYEMYRCLSWR